MFVFLSDESEIEIHPAPRTLFATPSPGRPRTTGDKIDDVLDAAMGRSPSKSPPARRTPPWTSPEKASGKYLLFG